MRVVSTTLRCLAMCLMKSSATLANVFDCFQLLAEPKPKPVDVLDLRVAAPADPVEIEPKSTRRSRAEINAEWIEDNISLIEGCCDTFCYVITGKLSDTALSEDQSRRIRDVEEKLKAIRTRSQAKPEELRK
jgi:hypothetical protein